MPAQFAEKVWGCYLLDVDQQTLVAYQYYPGEKQLRLIAARNYRWDRKLQNLNTDHPTPLEVKELLDKEAQNPRGAPPRGAVELDVVRHQWTRRARRSFRRPAAN